MGGAPRPMWQKVVATVCGRVLAGWFISLLLEVPFWKGVAVALMTG